MLIFNIYLQIIQILINTFTINKKKKKKKKKDFSFNESFNIIKHIKLYKLYKLYIYIYIFLFFKIVYLI